MKRNKISGQLSFEDLLKKEELNSFFDSLILPAEQYAMKNGSLHIGTAMRVFHISAVRAQNIVNELIKKGVLKENGQVYREKKKRID